MSLGDPQLLPKGISPKSWQLHNAAMASSLDRDPFDRTIYILTILIYHHNLPVVPHKAVAEVSEIGNL